MPDEPPGAVDELLHHRLQPPVLGWVVHRRLWSLQAALAHQAQEVHRQRRRLAHRVIGVEIAQGQPLQSEAGLELAWLVVQLSSSFSGMFTAGAS